MPAWMRRTRRERDPCQNLLEVPLRSIVWSIHLQLVSTHDVSHSRLSGANAHTTTTTNSSSRTPVLSHTLNSLRRLGHLSRPHHLSPTHASTTGRLVTLLEIVVQPCKGSSPEL
jgi:hypothetical protein